MPGYRKAALPTLVLVALVFLLSAIVSSGDPPAALLSAVFKEHNYLPLVAGPPPTPTPTPTPTGCPATSSRQYVQQIATQYDLDNPVRPAELHADKNLALRGYTSAPANAIHSLVNYGTDDPKLPPQFATMFYPSRVPPLVGFYSVYDWNWAPSPTPGTRGAPLTTYKVTALGLQTTRGELLRVPVSAYSIGGDPVMEVMVIYADEDTIALRYTREDSSASVGYTLHVDKICVDPNLLALYNLLDGGKRYEFHYRGWQGYNLPTLRESEVFGTARGSETVVAIVDTGNFMDPRSCNEWWQYRPGYAGSCPQHD